MIYLIRSGQYFKIGHTQNLCTRMRQYVTDNPSLKLLATINTQAKTKHRLETALHRELIRLGYKFHKASILDDEISTEWFRVSNPKSFQALGLTQFKACKGRMITEYRKNRPYAHYKIK